MEINWHFRLCRCDYRDADFTALRTWPNRSD
jgi:hypothetical protein